MGSSQSAIVKSLEVALGDKNLVAAPNKFLYQSEDVRRYNLAIPVTPAAVTYPKTTAQVAAIVKCAADAGLKVQPRSGGHSYGNYSAGGVDGAVVIDMKHFQQFSMDRKTWRATVGAGTLLGAVSKRMHDAGGRAMAHGICPQVGLGGHATIGGLGPISRQYGSCLDHIEEVEVVLADASIKRASATQHSDLFWAMKGAGNSFGIVTEFVFRTEPEPGNAVHFSYTFSKRPYKSMAPMFKAWQAFVSEPDLTRKFSSEVVFTELGMVISGTYFGTRAEYDALQLDKKFPGHQVARFITFDDYLSMVLHWAEDGALKLGGGIAAPFYAKTLTFNGADLIPDNVIDDFLQYLDDTPKGTPVWFIIFDLEGGAINDVAPDATSYAHRDALFYMQSYGVALDLRTGTVSLKLRDFLNKLNILLKNGIEAGPNFGSYAGYVDPELKDGPEEYWRYNLPRLEQIKRQVDPNDVFKNPQSVAPAGVVEESKPRPPMKLTKRRFRKGTYGKLRLLFARLL